MSLHSSPCIPDMNPKKIETDDFTAYNAFAPHSMEIKKIGENRDFGKSIKYNAGTRNYAEYWRVATWNGWKNLYLPIEFFYELSRNVPDYFTYFKWIAQQHKSQGGATYYNLYMLSPDRTTNAKIKQITVSDATTTGLSAYHPSGHKTTLETIDFTNIQPNTLLIHSRLRNNDIGIWLNDHENVVDVSRSEIIAWFGHEFRHMLKILAARYVNRKGNKTFVWNPISHKEETMEGTNGDAPTGPITMDIPQNEETYKASMERSTGFFAKMADYRKSQQRNPTNLSSTATVRMSRPPPPDPAIESSFADPQIIRRFHTSLGNMYAINAQIMPQASIMVGKIHISFICDQVVVYAMSKCPSRLSNLDITYNENAYLPNS